MVVFAVVFAVALWWRGGGAVVVRWWCGGGAVTKVDAII